jgi:hypothetical protein
MDLSKTRARSIWIKKSNKMSDLSQEAAELKGIYVNLALLWLASPENKPCTD